MKKTIFFTAVLTVLLSLVSCGTTLRSIKENPQKYAGQEITISGSIIKINAIPLTTIGVFEVYDETETLYVVTTKANSHRQNDKADIKGVIYFLGGEAVSETTTQFIEAIEKILVEKNIVDEGIAGKTAEIAAKFIEKLLEGQNLVLVMVES